MKQQKSRYRGTARKLPQNDAPTQSARLRMTRWSRSATIPDMRSTAFFALFLASLVVPACDDATTYPGLDARPIDAPEVLDSSDDVLNAPADAPQQPVLDASVEAG